MIHRFLALIISVVLCIPAFGQLRSVDIGDAVIHYLEMGSGVPVVYVHGGFEDYRTFEPQLEAFSKNYRAIAYSRRFNYPNTNTNELANYSAETEADDLAAMIKELNLEAVHLIGHSFGGLTALVFTIKYPAYVRSLTLSEPATLSWLPHIPNGQAFYDQFYKELAWPAKTAFSQGDTAQVLTLTFNYFYGSDISGDLTPEIRAMLVSNFPEWRAVFDSPVAFTPVEIDKVQAIRQPILLLTGGQTIPLFKLMNPELISILPNAAHVHVPDGTHDFWFTHPELMGKAVIEFISKH